MRVKCKQNDTRMYHYSIVPVPIETDKSLLIFRVCKYINRDTCMHTEFAHRTRKKTHTHPTIARKSGDMAVLMAQRHCVSIFLNSHFSIVHFIMCFWLVAGETDERFSYGVYWTGPKIKCTNLEIGKIAWFFSRKRKKNSLVKCKLSLSTQSHMDVFSSKFMYPISTNQINKSSLNRIASEPAIPNEKRAHILYASVLDFFFRVCVCVCFYSLAPKKYI